MFFASALNGLFVEASGVVTLPEDDPAASELFTQWLYAGKQYLAKRFGNYKEEYDITCVVNAWNLGDKLGCLAFRDFAMICLINAHCDGAIETNTIQHIYKCSPAGSSIRRWAVHQFVSDASAGYYRKACSGATSCALRDLVDWAGTKLLQDLDDWGFDVADYLMRSGEESSESPNSRAQRYLEVLEYESLC